MEHILDAFPSDGLEFVVDTYWVQVGGADSAEWIRRYKGQVYAIHLKDLAVSGESKQIMAPIGEGNMNWDSIFKACADSGTKYMLVEQDNCNGENPFDCLKRSYDYLKSKGFD